MMPQATLNVQMADHVNDMYHESFADAVWRMIPPERSLSPWRQQEAARVKVHRKKTANAKK